ncbi:MAG TPA: glycosyltransferase family 39 protein [Steroidobacteraceae bacterium]|jgi:hypothetical protein
MAWFRLPPTLAPVLLAVLACLLCTSTYRVFGNFWDEPEHLAAGLSLIDRGEYRYDNQHPPLARIAAAIGPYLAGVRLHGEPLPLGDAQGRALLYDAPIGYERALTLARLGMLPFLVILVAATWLWARRWLGAGAALLAVLLLVSTPVILGQAAVVALDLPVTALTTLTLYLLLRWFESPGWRTALWLGVAAGAAMATKMSAIPFIGVAAATLIVLRVLLAHSAPVPWMLARRSATAAFGLVLAIAILVGVYGTRLVYLIAPDQAVSPALDFYAGHSGQLHDLVYRWAARVPLPLGFMMVPLNILGVQWHNEHGHLSFLLGQTAAHGWWYFYLVALAVKSPLPLLLLGLAGLAALAVRGLRDADLYLLAPAASFLSILVFCCAYSHINIGVRHVLIAFPLLALGAGYGLHAGWQRWQALPARALLALLLVWQLALVATAWPDYLAYFNPLAGRHPEHILVDSDLDWGGQDLRRLEQVLQQRGVQQLWIGYKGTADLAREHLPAFTLLAPNQPVRGWVAITMLTLQENQSGYAWLLQHPPLQRIGASFELYYIP